MEDFHAGYLTTPAPTAPRSPVVVAKPAKTFMKQAPAPKFFPKPEPRPPRLEKIAASPRWCAASRSRMMTRMKKVWRLLAEGWRAGAGETMNNADAIRTKKGRRDE